ncbi:hypothetical protein Tco_0617470 [Tanacetum coccineum]
MKEERKKKDGGGDVSRENDFVGLKIKGGGQVTQAVQDKWADVGPRKQMAEAVGLAVVAVDGPPAIGPDKGANQVSRSKQD